MANYDNVKDESAKQQRWDHQKETGMLQDNIPIIDFAGIDGLERRQICHQIAKACETWGFFHLINHGIEQSFFKSVKELSMEFFHGPVEEKMRIKVRPPRIDGWNHCEHMSEGFNLIRKDTVEHLFLCYYPDREENVGSFPQHPGSYRSTLLEYAKKLEVLGEKLLGILSEMLGLAPEAIRTALSGGSPSGSL